MDWAIQGNGREAGMICHPVTAEEWLAKITHIGKQVRETVEQEAQGVTIRLATITCACRWKRGIMNMYQCLYCNEWLCELCAERHFGKTRKQYREEHPVDYGAINAERAALSQQEGEKR